MRVAAGSPPRPTTGAPSGARSSVLVRLLPIRRLSSGYFSSFFSSVSSPSPRMLRLTTLPCLSIRNMVGKV